MPRREKAVVLLSGGLDSAACLYWAKARGWEPVALSVDYGQRHAREMSSARRVARAAGARRIEVRLGLPWLRVSSLVDPRKRLPDTPLSRIGREGIPSTYVPARNTMLLALAASLAEAEGAARVVIGANHMDYSGYPDCRPAFNRALEKTLRLGTKAGAQGRAVSIETPLIRMDKAAIVRLALELGVPLKWTWSCYRGGRRPCGTCESCRLRAKGFAEAGVSDPAHG